MSNAVTEDPKIPGSKPVFAGIRVPARSFFDHLEAHDFIDDSLDGFPSVKREQVLAPSEESKGHSLAPSFEHIAETFGLSKAKVLADTLDAATGKFLEQDRSPGRKLGTTDNRGSHFYVALYWAQALAAQDDDKELKALFTPVAEQLTANEKTIADELLSVQGKEVNIGGYYQPDDELASAALRPSRTFNKILASI